MDELNNLPAPPLVGSLTTIRDAIGELAARPDVPDFVRQPLVGVKLALDGVLDLLSEKEAV